ncbi:MAG: hypothetical protein AAFR61_28210 [Bacteroidota bacterium]
MTFKPLSTISLFVSVGLIAMGCQPQKAPETPAEETQHSDPISSLLSGELSYWAEYYHITAGEFDQDTTLPNPKNGFFEYPVPEDSKVVFTPDSLFAYPYSLLISITSDGRYALDPTVYLNVEKTSGGWKYTDGDPDSAVDLYDMQEKKVFKVSHCGTACLFEEAVFLGDSLIALAGQGEVQGDDDFYFAPFVQLIHLTKLESSYYQSNRSMEAGMAYIEQKLQHLSEQ